MKDMRDQPTSPTLLGRLSQDVSPRAWEQFVDCYSEAIFSWASGIGLQESDAADVTQEVLLKLLGLFQEFEYDRQRGSFRGWLKTVTVNAAKDCARRLSRQTRDASGLSHCGDAGGFAELESNIDRQYRLNLLQQAREMIQTRVQPQTWLAYQLTAEEGLSASAASNRIGIKVSDVYVAKSRVIKLLRQTVAGLEHADGGGGTKADHHA